MSEELLIPKKKLKELERNKKDSLIEISKNNV